MHHAQSSIHYACDKSTNLILNTELYTKKFTIVFLCQVVPVDSSAQLLVGFIDSSLNLKHFNTSFTTSQSQFVISYIHIMYLCSWPLCVNKWGIQHIYSLTYNTINSLLYKVPNQEFDFMWLNIDRQELKSLISLVQVH